MGNPMIFRKLGPSLSEPRPESLLTRPSTSTWTQRICFNNSYSFLLSTDLSQKLQNNRRTRISCHRDENPTAHASSVGENIFGFRSLRLSLAVQARTAAAIYCPLLKQRRLCISIGAWAIRMQEHEGAWDQFMASFSSISRMNTRIPWYYESARRV